MQSRRRSHDIRKAGSLVYIILSHVRETTVSDFGETGQASSHRILLTNQWFRTSVQIPSSGYLTGGSAVTGGQFWSLFLSQTRALARPTQAVLDTYLHSLSKPFDTSGLVGKVLQASKH